MDLRFSMLKNGLKARMKPYLSLAESPIKYKFFKQKAQTLNYGSSSPIVGSDESTQGDQ
jgi:hypothetical protein